jgi:hypothetical protein
MKRAPIRVATRAGLTGLVVLVVGAVVPNAAVGQVRGDAARNCEDVVFAPNTEDAAFEVRTTSVSCATTRKIIRAVRRDDALRPRGFSCRYRIDSSQAMVFTRYTCTKGRAAVRWLYGGVGSPLSARCSGFRVSGTRITHVRAYLGVSCRRARGVIRRVYTGQRAPRGWSCHTAGTEGGCTRPTGSQRPLLTWRAPDVDS